MEAANKYERAICVMYDLSGMKPGEEGLLLKDIAEIARQYSIKDHVKNPSYLYHNGKPLVTVWGVGFNDNRRYGLKETERIIDSLKLQGFSVMLGVPTQWRELKGDTESDPHLHQLIRKCDIVMPWFVGRYNENTYPKFQKLVEADIQWAKKNQVDYAPLVFPGFSWGNMKGQDHNSFMTAYNALNNVPCTLNSWLLQKVLRRDWGFQGYVVSDCGGPSLLVNAHKYVKTKEAAATLSIKAGLDLECGDDVYYEPLLNAYKQYMVSDADIDSAAYHVLKARMRLGLFDNGKNNPYTKISPSIIGSKLHQRVALEAARQCIVLLKNHNWVLPLDTKKLKSIAVVGINAGNCEFGDYSGSPVIAPISILQGIKERVGKDIKVVYAPWKSAVDGMELIQGISFPDGLKAEYFDNIQLKGIPKVRKEEWINFEPGNQAPDPFLFKSPLSVRWTGKLRPTVTGQYVLSFTSDDGCRLSIDNQMLIDAWQAHAVSTDSASIYLEAGKEYQLKAEYYDNRDYAIAKLQWKVPQIGKATRLDLYGEAGKAVRECETVIAVMGINKSIEREGQDRYDIQLPADQREFLQEIYKVNSNMIVILVAGSSLAINWMDEHVPAIVNAWYPGEQGGTAVAEVLFGDYNPAGRLPLTYYKSLDELPPFDDYDITKGRTYKYFKGEVLYPFGYGLSYSSFKYSDLRVKDEAYEVAVSFRLKNTGKRNGDEVTQVYVRIPETGGIVPVKELKGFRRVPLKSGESRRVEIRLNKEQLRYWDVGKGQFVVPKGTFDIMVGASSKDIRLQTVIDL